MKKTLLAAALLAGFAGVAQAETSVTLYGILDTGIGYQNIRGVDGIDKQSKFGMLNGVQNGSRWGLRGSEDLGDGLRAVFTIESGFNSGDGNSAQGGRLFGRQATIGLASNSWGQLDFGRQTNIASKFFGSIDPFAEGFGLANIGTVFSSSNTTRYDNMVLYQSPVFGGFQVGAGYSFNIDDTNTAQTGFNTNNNQRAITTGLRYVNGPLNLAAAYDQVNRNSAVADSAAGGPGGDRIRAWLLGGAYDFEVVKVSAAYGQTKGGWIQATNLTGLFTSGSPNLGGSVLPTNSYSDDFKSQQWMVGLSAPIGGATSVFGSWQRANVKDSSLYTSGTFAGEDSNMNVYSLGVTYDLSKRTNLYALGSYTNNYGFVDGLKSTLVGVGIRHRF
ncbi:porin [Bordetella genomosp. 8]|uniref:Porin n=1 Tax=Bordetella genomosp. 8 TaxID=1416806 RepID=A0A1W6YPH6_9BORD|nr:porin [Bordetella genomosp. 8]ARP82819.1 porin [Bordetella genomosp. 8]